MATTIEMTHDFPFSVEDYLAIYFSPAYVQHVKSQGNYEMYDAESVADSDEHLRRTVRMAPRSEMPRWIKRVVGAGQVILREHTEHRRGSGELTIEIVPSVLHGKVQMQGQSVLQPLDGQGCRCTTEMRISVSVLGIGGRMEQRMSERIREYYDRNRDAMLAYRNASPG